MVIVSNGQIPNQISFSNLSLYRFKALDQISNPIFPQIFQSQIEKKTNL